MAGTTQIYNQGFNIEASLINADIANNPQYLPLKYSSIKYLEIIDNLNAFTWGKATLDNSNDSLNSSPVYDFANLYTNFFNFKAQQLITDQMFTEMDETFVINNIYTLPDGEVDNDLIITFEDVFSGTLKNKTINDAAEVPRYKTGLCSNIVRNILMDYNATQSQTVGTWNNTNATVTLQFDPSASIHDILCLAYHNNSTSSTGGYKDAIFNLLSKDGDFGTNRNDLYTLTPINDKFLKLYRSLQGSGRIDVSETVTEGFMESGAQIEDTRAGNIKGYSEISELQILRPDPQVIRDTYRNTVIESVSDSGSSLIDVISIVESLDNFFKLFCNNPNYRLDIPFDITTLSNPDLLAKNARKVSAMYPELEPANTQAKLYNTILLNSKAINFRVRGQLFRKSGTFFYLQPRRQSNNDKHYNSLVGFWYIVQVVHVFNGNTYDNIISAVNPFTRNN